MILPLSPTIVIVTTEGYAEDTFRQFLLQVAEESDLSGQGSPEGVIEANRGRQYMDEAGSTGSILYIKKFADIAGDRKQGWILV